MIARGPSMLSATRCAWLEFVEANRIQAAVIPLAGFLVLIAFFLLQERIGNLPRRIFQIAIAVFVFAGVGVVIYEIESPQQCERPSALINEALVPRT
jgi:hypothetical protein